MNRYVGNLPPVPGVFPDYPAPVVRNIGSERELVTMRWGMPPPPRTGGPPVTNIRNTSSPHWRGWLKPENRCLVPANSFAEYSPEPNLSSGERHDQVGLSLDEHPLVSNRAGFAAETFPIGYVDIKRDTATLRPFGGQRICSAGAAGNHSAERPIGMEAIELRIDGGAVVEIAAAAHGRNRYREPVFQIGRHH
jgi:hypothetical protein